MGKVRTVRGDIDVDELGVVDAHDHLMIIGGPALVSDADLRIDQLEDAVKEGEAFRGLGGQTIVDAMPTGCGRDARALAVISERTGLNIIASAGFHKEEYYGDLHWARRYPIENMTQLIYEECTSGIDYWDYSGPIIQRLPVRPGVLKVATGYNAIRPMEDRALTVVANVHRATGLPIITHTDQGTLATVQVDRLKQEGVPVEAIAICHMDRHPDLTELKAVLDRGAWLIFDGAGREHYRPMTTVMEAVHHIIAWGYGHRLMFGGDIARRSYRRSQGGIGVAGAYDRWTYRLQSEGIDGTKFFIHNPRIFFSLR